MSCERRQFGANPSDDDQQGACNLFALTYDGREFQFLWDLPNGQQKWYRGLCTVVFNSRTGVCRVKVHYPNDKTTEFFTPEEFRAWATSSRWRWVNTSEQQRLEFTRKAP